MTSAISRSVSSPSARRLHYQSQVSNASLSLSQTFSNIDSLTLNDTFPSFIYPNPLVTIIYSSTSSSKGSVVVVKTTEIKKPTISGTCTFIRLIYGDNQQILLNSYSSCRRLLDHLKPVIGIQHDETIDLMDNEGKLKELNTHAEEYASTYLQPRNTYYVFKIDIDTQTNQKMYTAFFNMDQLDSKLYSVLHGSMQTLNAIPKGGVRAKRLVPGLSKQNSSTQPTSNAAPVRVKRTSNKK